MTIIFTMSIILLMIPTAMMLICLTISKKSFMDREKSSPFECGFDPKSSPRIPFSLHFFLIAVIFLIFDVEITLLIPLILVMKISNMINYWIISIFFIIILLLGLYHEWNQGALNWTY
uniref:NADH-ubiquinone oxidoreductase chain 3 n=1 Tax=Cheirotonus gestroi TaxID=1207173 RepID=A0A6H0EXR2_9SCAR|nr:NADH dehydrogenase subunit 3 [Cheirotonus gestroi]QIT06605.1 NADH dehydrogenase subunit 3 [Cheirotonus gestroi]